MNLDKDIKEKIRFQRVFDRLPISIVISDNNDRNLYINPKFTEILGYTIEDIPDTDTWTDLAYPDQEYQKIIITKTPEISKKLTKPRINEVRCKDGSIRSIQFQDISIDDDQFITILQDVTEKLKTENMLIKSQQRFRKIVEYFPIPSVVTTKKGDAVYINPAFKNSLGYTIEDIPDAKTWYEKAYPDLNYRKSIIDEYESQNFDKKSPRERHITCKNGEIKDFILQDINIGDEDLTVFQDITALRKAEMNFQELVENSRDMIFIIDEKKVIRMVNPAVTDTLGYSKDEILNHSAFDFVFLETNSPSIPAFPNQNNLREVSLQQVEILKKDGDRITIEYSTQDIIRNGKKSGLLAFCRDISNRKKIIEERFRQQKIESIGLLAGGLAHDFNNILVSILGNINLLQMEQESFTNEQQDMLTDLEHAARQARNLTKQLLTFSKGGAPIKKPESIEEVIRDSANFILRGSKSKCVFDFELNLPPVDIDAGQINQVLNNILINASQAMPDGGIIKINVFCEQIENNSIIPLKPGKFVKLEISDTGVGIPKSIQHKIFEPYFTTKSAGSGLGLTTSYSILKKHKGYITFSSKEGVGTTFLIYLPVSIKKKQVKNEQRKQIKFSNKQIFVLDDDKNIHRLLKRVLNQMGLDIVSSYNGKDILVDFQKAEKQGKKINLVFLDLTIPGGIGGKEAVKILRKHYPELKIIVFSGYSNDQVIANFKDYGFDDYLEKPFSIKQLQEILQKWLK
ncbi:MAG: PAS domain-containing hybrid sensor histidine kinase/response regulator [Promethearchaeota archaeon]